MRSHTRALLLGDCPYTDGDLTEDVVCNTAACPSACVFADWGPWGPCSTTCGAGFRFRWGERGGGVWGGGCGCNEVVLLHIHHCVS